MNPTTPTPDELAALTLDIARSDDAPGAVASSLREAGWEDRAAFLMDVIEVLARRCHAVHDAAAASSATERLRVLASLLTEQIEAAAAGVIDA